MSQNQSLLKAKGLFSFPSHLGAVPPGAMLTAKNVVIDREEIVESRRGYKLYGNAMGSGSTNTAHQLLNYKERLLRHYGTGPGTILEWDGGTGTFTPFKLSLTGNTAINDATVTNLSSTAQLFVGMFVSGTGIPAGATILSITNNTTFELSADATANGSGITLTFTYKISEVSTGLRIKGIEQNGNFYFTTNEGIKKISVASASGFSTSVITNSGGIKALDCKADINNNSGFLSVSSVVAYRIVWGIEDANNNLILGTPSERVIVRNTDGSSTKTVNLTITIPRGVTTEYFYQVYRTAVFPDTGDDDPGDEQRLVYENNPLAADLTNGYVAITDITPDGFRGANLYTNADSGEGIAQSNDVPPLAKDITSFKGYTFYANTETRHRLNLALLSVSTIKAYKSGTITNNTVANPTVVTSAQHGLVNGRTILISGSNSTPTLNGSRVVTVVDANTFTVPVNVTVQGTTGTWVTTDHSTFTVTDGTTSNVYTWSTLTKEADTHTNTTLDGLATTADLTPGMSLSGADIATGTYIVRIINSTSIELSEATTGTTSNVSITFAAESDTNKRFALSRFPTPAQQVEETARSMVRIINSQESEIINAFYLSGVDEVPGMMLFEARALNQSAFYLNVDTAATTGIEFNPNLPISGNEVISTNEVSPNRVYYSKFQQPEAVPILNFIDVGPKDKEIIRILSLRDNLFILKEEGVYRLSGLTAPFQVYPFDFSAIIKAADSAVVLNNLIYMFTNQGITTVSDTGVAVISRPIEDKLISLPSPQFTNFSTVTFGVSYESDRAYYLFTVTDTSDSVATQCFRFNTFTNTWTIFDISKRCGLVNVADDKLYLAAADTNFLEQERKTFDRTDYADREVSVTLSASCVDGVNVTLPSLTNISVGDILVQVQYLTISQFNRLLTKLDNDGLLAGGYFAALEASPGLLLSDQVDDLIDRIANDASRVAVAGSTSAGTYTALSPVASGFSALQDDFNDLIALLNADLGVQYSNYQTSEDTVSYELPILALDSGDNEVITNYEYPLLAGPTIVYNHIDTIVQFVPQYFGDVSMLKQISEGTFIFEDASFTEATISYSSDLSGDFESIDVEGNGPGLFGASVYGNGIYGGNGSGVPFRTLIPRNKQYSRYLNPKFEHIFAREIFSLYGISFTFRPISQRAYR